MKNYTVLFLILVLFTACKTQEQIQREQMVDNLSIQMRDSQTTRADYSVRLQEMEQRMSVLNGQQEETAQEQNSLTKDKITQLEGRIKLVEDQNQKLLDSLTENQEELQSQKVYLNKVLKTLGKISAPAKKSKKKLSAYEQAMYSYKKGR
jgi:chromosome segregation ATPase